MYEERSPITNSRRLRSPIASRAQSSKGHVLLVCPPVFSYHLSIKAELERLGYGVTWWNDRGNNRTVYKICLRLLPRVVTSLLTLVFMSKLRYLRPMRVRKVLVIKGEGVSIKVLQALRRQFPEAVLSLYFWDSVANAPRARAIAPYFDKVSTFDPVDARRYGWAHRPLFARAESVADAAKGDEFRYDWCFIGTLHSDRYRVIERLRRNDFSRKAFIFGYAPSRVVMFVRLLTNRSLWRVPRGSISTQAMSAGEIAEIFGVSRAVLDIEHPRQRGLTMRTIEALLTGRKLITTNPYVRESNLYHPSRVCVIERARPFVPQSFFRMAFEPVDPSVRYEYSLNRWVTDLIGDV